MQQENKVRREIAEPCPCTGLLIKEEEEAASADCD